MSEKVLILILSVCLFSCKNENRISLEEENTYQILTYLTNDFKQYLVLPPSFPPPHINKRTNFKIQDSLDVYKYFIKQSNKKKTIALTEEMFEVKQEYSFRDKCEVEKKLMSRFNSLNVSKKLNLSKVTSFGKDSLMYYKKEFKELPQRGFDKIDLVLNFSRIAFNDNFNKAIVIVGASKGRLSGFSTLVYLEKENYVWKIKCQLCLSIS